MFGSKIRSWMENHIVRPRKRCNKNKHNSSNNPNETSKRENFSSHTHINDSQLLSPTEIVSSSHGSSSNSISNHHYGNNLGNGTASPARRREVSPIQNHSRYGWQSPDSENITSPKSDNFLYASQHNHHHHHRVKHHHVKQNLSETNQKDTIPSKGSLQILPNNKQSRKQQHQEKHQHQQQQSLENTSSSFSSLSWSTGSKEQNSNNSKELNGTDKNSSSSREYQQQNFLQVSTAVFDTPTNNKNNLDDNADSVHYEEIQTAVLRHPENINNINFFSEPERPKSEQFISTKQRTDYDSPAARYGKLLPSRIRPNACGSNDKLNMNPSIYVIGSAESLTYNTSQVTGITNGNTYSTQYHNRFRTGGNAPPFHGLSSPESAYSTGYSTDGTSPGTVQNHPPEYYINMRTGTHYFPKSINSLTIEAQRCRFGLNKIEEMSPIDPLPKIGFASSLDKMSNPQFYVYPDSNMEVVTTDSTHHTINIGNQSPISQRNTIKIPTLNGFETSSPRQRCRIRTNPWYSTNDSTSSTSPIPKFGVPVVTPPTNSTSLTMTALQRQIGSPKRATLSDTPITANILKINGSIRRRSVGEQTLNHISRTPYESCSSEESDTSKHSTSSLTEVECPNEVRSSNSLARNKLHIKENMSALKPMFSGTIAPIAYSEDEDATLNEMMGKFDESYIYEKETDILSDSDATNCPSDLDTGLDAGDECDTEELLDIDFIDTSSMHEMSDKQAAITRKNVGNFSKRQILSNSSENISRQSLKQKNQTPGKQADNRKSLGSGSQSRRKRLRKTRKKSNSEQKENVAVKKIPPPRKSRETRSVGGTPISLRRNAGPTRKRDSQTLAAMSTRASSLVFSHKQEPRYLTIAESSKALLKADLEADVKYRQLIQEAESILVTLKNSNQSIPRETPVSSPRRINPLLNKRVEMLKSCEARQPQPIQQQHQQHQQRHNDTEHDMNVALNKRIELLKYKTSSAPNSPKSAPRFSPSKTHITNFINQMDGQRKANNTPPSNEQQRIIRPLQDNDYHRQSLSNVASLHKQSLRIDSVTNINRNQPNNQDFDKLSNFYIANPTQDHRMDIANHNCLPDIEQHMLIDDYKNHNMKKDLKIYNNNLNNVTTTRHNRQYCPQSEPLKRKVYKTSNTFERIKREFELEKEYAKQSILYNSNNLLHDQQNTTSSTNVNLLSTKSSSQDLNLLGSNFINKKQLILDTLSDLKQNLENQSVELNGLNAN